ncbi:cadmium resistance transporter [Mesorhizobium sp. VK25A]|uniref:Cadmium resistance transporter n=1 Tax=Mesorhizobium vachelliae TaxID=3072309 RepID=A0ABU5ACX1_9HYPH|nr:MULTISPECIES: cadmium resistance transporter [unclassified Mesorhizobium]MDX8534792.1 cadmium resistance transporter [Mesorhizobium sp. VK25D]MDX8547325.1 cadmium resistance transporter [Mesorhizobium sp. VK25A]
MLSTIGVAATLFAASNIDDIFVLLGFFGHRKFHAHQVVIGQCLGFAVLVAVSLVASLVSLVLAPAYVGLLGFLPILIGLKKLYDLWRGGDDDEASTPKPGLGNIFAVAAVTVANGSDNIGIYTPVFATSTKAEIGVTLAVFATGVAVWLIFAHWLVNHPALGAPIRRYGHWLVPFALIAIGAFIIYDAGSLALLQVSSWPTTGI